ncbi:MAG: sel1 repeat family protein [Lachnospiraceae bacterium]|nr:sel1 repeat family protein [Lachnospiraceae bacterium]
MPYNQTSVEERLDMALHIAEYSVSNPMLQELADEGCAAAEYYLGLRYYDGSGFEENIPEAARRFAHALLLGHEPACEGLGRCWKREELPAADKEALLDRLRQQAEQGNGNSIYIIGLIREEETAAAEALPYYEKAAALGNSEALYRLGVYYHNLDEEEKAVEYFQRAAKQENGKAAYCLGNYYMYGEEAVRDYAQAFACYQAAQSEDLGSFQLGCCYEHGIGTGKDAELAAAYYDDYLEGIELPVSALGRLIEFDGEEEGDHAIAAELGLGRCLLQMDEEDTFRFGSAKEHLKEVWENGSGMEAEWKRQRQSIILALSTFTGLELRQTCKTAFRIWSLRRNRDSQRRWHS